MKTLTAGVNPRRVVNTRWRVTSSEHQPGSIRTKRPSLIGRTATSVGKREIPVPAQAASTRMLNSLVHRIGSNATTVAASSGPVRVQLWPGRICRSPIETSPASPIEMSRSTVGVGLVGVAWDDGDHDEPRRADTPAGADRYR